MLLSAFSEALSTPIAERAELQRPRRSLAAPVVLLHLSRADVKRFSRVPLEFSFHTKVTRLESFRDARGRIQFRGKDSANTNVLLA